MKPTNELLDLYENFFTKLNAKLGGDEVRSERFAATDEEIDALSAKYNLYVPDDLRTFWKSLSNVHEALIYDSDDSSNDWVAGWDFVTLDLIARDMPMKQGLAVHYDEGDPIRKLHDTGLFLTYEEPMLLIDADPATKAGTVHWMCYDGAPLPEAVAPDLNTFLEHWLATGCFRQGNFEAYYEVVKDILPVHIPVEENLWLRYYNKIYGNEKANAAAQDAGEDAFETAAAQSKEAVELWNEGREEEAAKLFEKALATGYEIGDDWLVSQTINNYAVLSSESGRKDDSIRILEEYLRDHPDMAAADARAICLLGQFYYENGRFEEGLAKCNEGLAADADYALGYYSRACAYVRLKRYKEAIADIVTAIELDEAFKGDIAADDDFAALRNDPDFKKAIGK